MRLRIRHANGITTLSDVSSEKTVLELKEDIIKAIAVSQDIQSMHQHGCAIPG